MSDRISFGKLHEAIQPPNLIELQIKSYEEFFQTGVEPSKRKNVGLQAVGHAARLLAGAPVRLRERHGLAGTLFPVFGERGVVVDVQLARRVIRNVEQGDGRRCLAVDDGGQAHAGQDDRRGQLQERAAG